MGVTGPVVLIGLDAVDLSEVRARVRDGRMPNLARFMGTGQLETLRPCVPGFAGATWRSFVNGVPVDEHGWHFGKVWRPEAGRLDAASSAFLRLRPFWDDLERDELRIGLVDIPYAPDPGEGFNGVYVSGWQTHDSHALISRPAGLLSELTARFGPPALESETYGPPQPSALLRLHQGAVRAIGQVADIGAHLLARESFDLFMLAIGAPHRAGHYLWDLSQIDVGRMAAAELAALRSAMDDIYAACDAAVGRLCDACPPGAAISVCALHGMGPNPGWTDIFPEILRHLAQGSRPGRRDLRERLANWRRSSVALAAGRFVPEGAQRLLRSAWSARMHDWSRTRYFALPREDGGALRINLAGREPQGIVGTNGEYAGLCGQLVDQLGEVRDLETDLPIVAKAHVVDDMVDAGAPYRRYLPDIVVEWGERRIGDSPGLKFPSGAELRWPRGRRLTSGRSGNHRPWGWVAGALINGDSAPPHRSAVDLAGAVMRKLGIERLRDGRRFGVMFGLSQSLEWAWPLAGAL